MTRHMLWSLSADDSPENAHIIESKLIDSRGASDDAKEGVMSFPAVTAVLASRRGLRVRHLGSG